MLNLQDILTGIDQLSEAEKSIVRSHLIDRFSHPGKSDEEYMTDERFSAGMRCVHCDAARIRRYGHTGSGAQRWYCSSCGRTFTLRTKSVFARTHKDLSVWKQYAECMFAGKSLRESASVCGISLDTAFSWRHKLLDALRDVLKSYKLGGVVEADETYVPVSYKGNHSRSRRFTMPRESRKRGGELHQSGISRELVCISCAVCGDGLSMSSAITLGRADTSEMTAFFAGRLEQGTVLCTDHEPVYHAYARESGLRHIQFECHEVRRGLSIQRINAYHSRLKHFLSGFRGVATKYLDNYLAWSAAKDAIARRGRREEAYLILKVLVTRISETCRGLRDRPPIPSAVTG